MKKSKSLTRYDVETGRFVLDTEPKTEYWPGTKVKKSKGNAFDWKHAPGRVSTRSIYTKVDLNKPHPFTTYSRAKGE